jgi:hypothetical protein
MPEIAHKTGIPLPVLYKWREQYVINSNWRPGSIRRTTNRIFTDTQEKTIAEYLREHFLTKHLPLAIGTMHAILLNPYSKMACRSKNFVVPGILSPSLCRETTSPVHAFAQRGDVRHN